MRIFVKFKELVLTIRMKPRTAVGIAAVITLGITAPHALAGALGVKGALVATAAI
jgi:hypothetical protein